MSENEFGQESRLLLEKLESRNFSAFDLIPHADIREKLVDLVLNDVPRTVDAESSILFSDLREKLMRTSVDDINVVVFGGGTGLSNIIGGDCRQTGWVRRPFYGLKQVFPKTRAIVCITDDGGSTGELLKDLPVFALGDIRHVMLSSIQLEKVQKTYDLTTNEALVFIAQVSKVFNFRFTDKPSSPDDLLKKSGASLEQLPQKLRMYLKEQVEYCFSEPLCRKTLSRPHCLGNLVMLAVICRSLQGRNIAEDTVIFSGESAERIYDSLAECAEMLGASDDAVFPCTVTPAQLRFHYGDGVQVTGENKSGIAQRRFPIDHVVVDFCGEPYVSSRLFDHIKNAHILIMAPGSLYSSIIPVMQVPGIADAIRQNESALKLLISNLWVQEGETDKSISDPDRKFHVSDMIKAYEQNLPGGTQGLFDEILCLSMQDVPASVIQNYAVEGKVPIYLDREIIKAQGFVPIECGFFSKAALLERQVIQHDPDVMAQTVKTLFLAREFVPDGKYLSRTRSKNIESPVGISRLICLPSAKYKKIGDRLKEIPVEIDQDGIKPINAEKLRELLVEIIWSHQDIPVAHLDNVHGVSCIKVEDWYRDQRWDNVFSYYDPIDGRIKLRQDRLDNRKNLEIAFLIALGQALLGDYAADKQMKTIYQGELEIGRVFHLSIRPAEQRNCYFSDAELREFLSLARMVEHDPVHFTRTVNGEEGFTPPGLMMGLMYAWYLDNRFSSHIEYKMSILTMLRTHLIPEQKKTRLRREQLIKFYREKVFGKTSA